GDAITSAQRFEVLAQSGKSRVDAVAQKQIGDPHASARRLVFVTRTNAAAGGAEFGAPLSLLAHQVESAVMREQDVSAIGDDEIRRHVDSETLDFTGLGIEGHR